MMRLFAFLLILLLSAAPIGATARGGGGGGGGRPAGGGAAARPSGGNAAASRPSGGGGGGGGFKLNNDYASTRPATPPNRGTAGTGGTNVANRPSGGNRPTTLPSGNGGNTVNRPSGGNGNGNTINRPVNGGGNTNVSGSGNTINRGGNTNISGNTINRNVYVANPVYRGPAWGWNHGVVWAPAYGYWGGGFWGPFAVGVTSALIYGSIVNSTTHVTYTSYQVQQSSPGATMLSNYGLTQVQCGPPNLVVIYGPSDSIICATPNQLVAAGNYNLDTSTLSLTNA